MADRIEAAATPPQKARLSALSPEQVQCTQLAGEPVQRILSHAPGNDAPIGGVKVVAESGWFAARPSGTEEISISSTISEANAETGTGRSSSRDNPRRTHEHTAHR